MRIEEAIKQLEEIKKKYGDLNLVFDEDNRDCEEIVVVKYVKFIDEYGNTIHIDTEDLNSDELDIYYINDVVEDGLRVNIY